MIGILLRNEQFFASTEEEANNIVTAVKEEHGERLRKHTIIKKARKGIEYFIVSYTVEFCQVRSLLDE